MKNLADFKKRLQVGVKLHTVYHQKIIGRHENGSGEVVYGDQDLGIREVSIKQSNSFAMKTWKAGENKFVNSWCAYPKATTCKILDEDTIQILEEDYRVREGEKPLIPILTYKFINEVEVKEGLEFRMGPEALMESGGKFDFLYRIERIINDNKVIVTWPEDREGIDYSMPLVKEYFRNKDWIPATK